MSAAGVEQFRLGELAPRLVGAAQAPALLGAAREAPRGPGDADVLARAVGFAPEQRARAAPSIAGELRPAGETSPPPSTAL
jgi:hypothetical protein